MENRSLNLANQEAAALIARFKRFYETFSADTLNNLDEIYTPDIEFIDPVHHVEGLLALKHYLRGMARNLTHYRIHYVDTRFDGEAAYVSWRMEFSHPSLNRGRMITLRGMSHLRYTHKVYFHEDCYDLGALFYEHVPLLGRLIRAIKRRAARQD